MLCKKNKFVCWLQKVDVTKMDKSHHITGTMYATGTDECHDIMELSYDIMTFMQHLRVNDRNREIVIRFVFTF